MVTSLTQNFEITNTKVFDKEIDINYDLNIYNSTDDKSYISK